MKLEDGDQRLTWTAESLRERIMSSSLKEQSLEENRIFSDVDLKGRRSPSSNGLYEIGRGTVFC